MFVSKSDAKTRSRLGHTHFPAFCAGNVPLSFEFSLVLILLSKPVVIGYCNHYCSVIGFGAVF